MQSKLKPILLIEDNEQDELLTIRALKKHNIHNDVIVLRDGSEALQYLCREGIYADRDPNIVPQIILLDLKLPKLNGLEVLKKIRATAETRHLPVIILTTSKEDSDIISGYDLGANSYVRKPVDFDAFTEAVRQLGLYWLVINEPIPNKSPSI